MKKDKPVVKEYVHEDTGITVREVGEPSREALENYVKIMLDLKAKYDVE
ncbi:hypothetical protein [Alkalihalobacillus sp. AL-G]|nr:hypothetical protein [Alkalihalobacillus sp. AL-G]WLD91756.1 hypothetical protein MOJ78_11975 [Alkalihalobacillus sp. AL-G]